MYNYQTNNKVVGPFFFPSLIDMCKIEDSANFKEVKLLFFFYFPKIEVCSCLYTFSQWK